MFIMQIGGGETPGSSFGLTLGAVGMLSVLLHPRDVCVVQGMEPMQYQVGGEDRIRSSG